MRVHNLTPFLFGTKVCSRKPPQPEMTLVVRATLLLSPDGALRIADSLAEQGMLRSEVYAGEGPAELCTYPGDFADFKLRTEVLMTGTCYPPGGRAARECPVKIRVGDWSKTIRVVGDRRWQGALKRPSEPEPFTAMPLGWDRSFGGPGFAKNPAGRGIGGDRLPNLETADGAVSSPSDRPEPAGFGPIHPAWPVRAAKVGKAYGPPYEKTRAPYYAEDFDWSYFNAAPRDQQLEGYLRGDETISLHNLHPEAPVIETQLPGERVRAFIEDVRGGFRELDMRLDTLMADMDAMTLYLTWRGVEPVAEDDLEDVAFVLIAREPLASRPRDEAHYRAELDAFKADPIGLEPLPPELLDAAERAELDPKDAGDQPNVLSAVLAQKLGDYKKEEQERIAASIEHAYQAAGDKRDALDAKLKEAVHQRQAAMAPPAVPRRPGVRGDARLRPTMRKLLEAVAEIKKSVAEQPAPPEMKERLLAKAAKLEEVPHDPRLKEIDPDYEPPLEPLPTDEPGPGANLSERDLAEADLAGRDLRGANLTMAVLTGANLRGANLAGANLHKAILYRADLSGADLSGAVLTRTMLAESKAAGARFDGADLDLACFEKADLEGASFVETRGEYQAMAGANLSQADARRASFDHADFGEARLEGARLEGAKLRGCIFSGCRAKAASLRAAKVGGSTFGDADLTGADLHGIDGERIVLSGAKLDKADLSLARLAGAHLTKSSAKDSNFYGADLRQGRAYRARLEGARFEKANLFDADLCKARLDRASFAAANLYGAKLVGASGKNADFTDAVLTRSTLEGT